MTGAKRWAQGAVYCGVRRILLVKWKCKHLKNLLFYFSEWKMNPCYCYSFKENMYSKNESRKKWILPRRELLWTTWVLFSRPDMGVLISWVQRFSLGRWKEFQRWRIVIVTQQYEWINAIDNTLKIISGICPKMGMLGLTVALSLVS